MGARAVLSADAGLLVITANIQSETGFPSSHQLKSYVAYKSCLKLAARAVLSADAGLLVFSVTTGMSAVRVHGGSVLFASPSRLITTHTSTTAAVANK